MCLAVLTEYQRVTDRQTETRADRQADRQIDRHLATPYCPHYP